MIGVKKMNKQKVLMAIALSTVIAVTGCTKGEEKSNAKPFTKEQEAEYVKKFSKLVLKPSEPSVILKEMDKNIARLSKQEASNMVDGLLYVMHQQNPKMNTKIQGLQEELRELEKKNIDYNNPENIDKVEDETLKAFLKEVYSKKFVIDKIGEDFVAHPDIQFVIDKYGKYMNDDLRAVAEFSLEENKKPFFNKETNSFDMNIVVQRILKIEENMKKFPKSFYLPAMQNSKNYYYQVYFGTNNSFLVDKDKKVLPSVLEHYRDTVKKHPNSQLAKDIQKVLDKLKATDYKVTDDVYVFLLELTGTQTKDVKQDTSATEEKANEKVKEAIQKAIEENKNSDSRK